MAKQPAEREEEQQEGDATAPKSKKKLLILVGVGLLALLLSVGGVLFFVLSGDDSPEAEEAVATEPAQPTREMAVYQPLTPAFVVNYTHEGRRRYMQVSVVLMGRDTAGMAELSNHMPLLRNELVMLFGSEEFASLMTPEGKETLRERATLAVKSLLEREIGNPVIESVLFTNIVLQ
ncbi:MAG: flagellar basal body-associated protein FliL [Gammaproteobacteria bacterium HGW-Gammaproteobacteria-11]|nr:MAG: flagellar basal body-associated protein FliL [Gammaproteobacteria bacterium HGW-Gammaproteobacteria-11]